MKHHTADRTRSLLLKLDRLNKNEATAELKKKKRMTEIVDNQN